MVTLTLSPGWLPVSVRKISDRPHLLSGTFFRISCWLSPQGLSANFVRREVYGLISQSWLTTRTISFCFTSQSRNIHTGYCSRNVVWRLESRSLSVVLHVKTVTLTNIWIVISTKVNINAWERSFTAIGVMAGCIKAPFSARFVSMFASLPRMERACEKFRFHPLERTFLGVQALETS